MGIRDFFSEIPGRFELWVRPYKTVLFPLQKYSKYNDARKAGLLTINPLDLLDMEGSYGTGVIV